MTIKLLLFIYVFMWFYLHYFILSRPTLTSPSLFLIKDNETSFVFDYFVSLSVLILYIIS